jgi:hypothetical protein
MVSQIDFTAILNAEQWSVDHTRLTIDNHTGYQGLLGAILVGQKAIKAFGLRIIGSELADGLPSDSKQAIDEAG